MRKKSGEKSRIIPDKQRLYEVKRGKKKRNPNTRAGKRRKGPKRVAYENMLNPLGKTN